MKKQDFYLKVVLYSLFVLCPLFALGLGLIITSNGSVGMVIGALVSWGIMIYFAKRLYDFVSFNKTLLTNNSSTQPSIDFFISRCSAIISEYEKESPLGVSSCKNIVIEKIKTIPKNNFPENDFEKSCHILLGNITYHLLASGEYHIHSGQLNVLGVAPSLKIVYIKSTQWLHDKGHITDEEYHNSINNLEDMIRQVG